MADLNPNSDRYFDLSLRLLTIFVLVSLVCCVTYLGWNWLGPLLTKPTVSRAVSPAAVAPAPPPAAVATPAPADEVLMDPHKTFRCIEKGHVSFSDRACDSGPEQLLPMTPPQTAHPPGTGR
jgi:hypothetical protein